MLTLAMNVFRILLAFKRSWQLPVFRAGTMLAILTLFSGTIFYRSVEGWSWIDSLYFSATTVSTVGYGDFAPATTLGKIFTIVYMFAGIGVFVLLFAQLAKAMLKVDLEE